MYTCIVYTVYICTTVCINLPYIILVGGPDFGSTLFCVNGPFGPIDTKQARAFGFAERQKQVNPMLDYNTDVAFLATIFFAHLRD